MSVVEETPVVVEETPVVVEETPVVVVETPVVVVETPVVVVETPVVVVETPVKEVVVVPVPVPVPTSSVVKTSSGNYTFLYGLEGNNVVDVTSTAYSSCLVDNVITIPGGDENRAAIFGIDPVFGYLKEVYIIDSAGNQTEYMVDVNIFVNTLTNTISTTPY
jgi:hypothetical protein